MMKTRYEAVIFDLDGTVLDTIGGLATSVNVIRKQIGLEEQPLPEIQAMVGNGIKNLISRSLAQDINQGKDVSVEKTFELFMAYYNEHCIENTWAYEGIVDLLKELKNDGVKLAIISNKADKPTKVLCNHFFDGLFDDVRGNSKEYPLKPNPEVVYACLDYLNVSREKTLYVGDSEVDIKTAVNTGLTYVSVSWGFKSRQFLEEHNSKVIVDSVSELKSRIYM